jgi:hypothetical protein
VTVSPPKDDDVIVRVEATPINASARNAISTAPSRGPTARVGRNSASCRQRSNPCHGEQDLQARSARVSIRGACRRACGREPVIVP